MKTYRHAPDPREAEVIANAYGYVVCGFRGQGKFDKELHATLDDARTFAQAMAARINRTVAIYAVMKTSSIDRQAHIENVEPARRAKQ